MIRVSPRLSFTSCEVATHNASDFECLSKSGTYCFLVPRGSSGNKAFELSVGEFAVPSWSQSLLASSKAAEAIQNL